MMQEIRGAVLVAAAGGRLVVSGLERAEGQPRRLLNEVVLHEEEVEGVGQAAVQAELDAGIPLPVVQAKDRLLLIAEYLVHRMVRGWPSVCCLVMDGRSMPCVCTLREEEACV
jgi:hypothetical protein